MRWSIPISGWSVQKLIRPVTQAVWISHKELSVSHDLPRGSDNGIHLLSSALIPSSNYLCLPFSSHLILSYLILAHVLFQFFPSSIPSLLSLSLIVYLSALKNHSIMNHFFSLIKCNTSLPFSPHMLLYWHFQI